MRTITELLVSYARYHRDRRNLTTHFVGVPMIIFAVGMALAQLRPWSELPLWTLDWTALAVLVLWYASRHLLLAVASGAWLLALLTPAHLLALEAGWASWCVTAFVVGWIIQFVGHYYEGRKPAFLDDLSGLVVAPIFLTAEMLFAAGWGRALREAVEAQAGPLHLRDIAHPAAR